MEAGYKHFSLRLPEDLVDQIDAEAARCKPKRSRVFHIEAVFRERYQAQEAQSHQNGLRVAVKPNSARLPKDSSLLAALNGDRGRATRLAACVGAFTWAAGYQRGLCTSLGAVVSASAGTGR